LRVDRIKIFTFIFLEEVAMADRGMETIAGIGIRKQAIIKSGGVPLDIAVAMLEGKTLAADYPVGDVYPDGRQKTGDAANFGICKQGWFMIRSSVSRYSKLKSTDFNMGLILNSNLALDIQVLHESQKFYGLDKWFAGHRAGESGLNGTWSKADIANYKNAVIWIRDQIISDGKYKSDDTRFWVTVPPV
jgi:hypothetical protein